MESAAAIAGCVLAGCVAGAGPSAAWEDMQWYEMHVIKTSHMVLSRIGYPFQKSRHFPL